MALRAELIGPYCLILVMSSVYADCWHLATCASIGVNVSARIDCGCPRVMGEQFFIIRLMGYRSTINSRIRTGTDSGNPTV